MDFLLKADLQKILCLAISQHRLIQKIQTGVDLRYVDLFMKRAKRLSHWALTEPVEDTLSEADKIRWTLIRMIHAKTETMAKDQLQFLKMAAY